MLGKVLAGPVVLLKVILMSTRGAAFTEPMRCAQGFGFGRMGQADADVEQHQKPSTIRRPFKTRFVFIPYRP